MLDIAVSRGGFRDKEISDIGFVRSGSNLADDLTKAMSQAALREALSSDYPSTVFSAVYHGRLWVGSTTEQLIRVVAALRSSASRPHSRSRVRRVASSCIKVVDADEV